MKKVNICGLSHEIVELEDSFNLDCHMGQINYQDLLIKINKNMPEELKEETLCHEIMHDILTHLGYSDISLSGSAALDNHDRFIKRGVIAEIRSMLLHWDPESSDDRDMLIDVGSIIEKLDEMADGLID